MNISVVSGVSDIAARIRYHFKGSSLVLDEIYRVIPTEEERDLLSSVLMSECISYGTWKKIRNNLVTSKIRKSYDRNYGTSYESALISIEILN